MTRVCMVVHHYYFRDSRVRHAAETLAAAGVEVDVLCLRHPQQPLDERRDRIQVFTIPVSHVATGATRYLLEYAAAMVCFSLWLLVLHLRRRYGIVHVHNMPDALVFTALVPRALGARIVLDVHDPMPEFYRSKVRAGRASELAVGLLRLQERLAAGIADAVIAANPSFRDALVRRGVPAEKVVVVNNIPDPHVFDRAAYQKERASRGEHFTLIYPGTIAPRYGLDVAVRALPQLAARIPHVRLQIIGPQGSYVTELAALAAELGVADRLDLVPLVPVAQIPGYIARADVGIYPAIPDQHMAVATPWKVLEYAVMGVPIVASRLPVLEQLFTDAGALFFEPGRADRLAARVIELYESPERREALVRAADAIFVHRHSLAAEQAEYVRLLNRLLGPGEQVPVADELRPAAGHAV